MDRRGFLLGTCAIAAHRPPGTPRCGASEGLPPPAPSFPPKNPQNPGTSPYTGTLRIYPASMAERIATGHRELLIIDATAP